MKPNITKGLKIMTHLLLAVQKTRALVIIACLVCVSGLAQAEERQVSVSATGEIAALPDIAIVQGRIVSQEKTAKQALLRAQEKLSRLIDYAVAQGLSTDDVHAAQVQVSPQWRYPKNKPRQISGYQGHAEFTLTLRELALLSSLYGGLVDAGANDLRPTTFEFSAREALELKAIAQAVAKAQRKADAALMPLKEKTGEVLSVNVDTQWHRPQPRLMRMEMASDAKGAAPKVNVGKQTITANVSVSFAID